MKWIGTGGLGLAVALIVSAAAAQVSDLYGRAWVRVSEPLEGEVAVDLPLVAVGGYAGSRGRRGQDLVIVVDVSDSTIESSGVDLDGDGELGVTSPNVPSFPTAKPARSRPPEPGAREPSQVVSPSGRTSSTAST